MCKYKSNTMYSLNDFANRCGHFYIGEVNNGYCCDHKEQTEEEDGEKFCCYFSCPLAYRAEEEDFENIDIDKNGWSKDSIEDEQIVIPFEDMVEEVEE